MLAPVLFNILFTAVLRVAEKRVLADAAITDNMVQLQQKENSDKKGTSRTGKIDGLRVKEGKRFRNCEVCFPETMRASYRDRQKGWSG